MSVPTIRLDRMALQIPEARERIRLMATGHHDSVRSLEREEILGEITELHLNRYAVSRLEVSSAHVFSRNGIVRGHVLFGQVNSLAVAVMDADVVLTAKTELRFHRSVRLGETLIGRADVLAIRAGVTKCRVQTLSMGETIVDGTIWVVAARDEHSEGGVRE